MKKLQYRITVLIVFVINVEAKYPNTNLQPGLLRVQNNVLGCKHLPHFKKSAFDHPKYVSTRGGGNKHHPVPSIKWPIFINFMYFLSIALTAPALPSFCNSFHANGADKVSSSGVKLHGVFTSIDQLFTFLFVSFWGSLSDDIGRRPLIILSSLGISMGWMTIATSSSLPLLFTGRAMDGITSCMLPISQSMVRDVSDPDQLTRNLGLLQGFSVGFAFIVGGMTGGILTQKYGPRLVFMVASLCGLISALTALVLLPETLNCVQITTQEVSEKVEEEEVQGSHQATFLTQSKEETPQFLPWNDLLQLSPLVLRSRELLLEVLEDWKWAPKRHSTKSRIAPITTPDAAPTTTPDTTPNITSIRRRRRARWNPVGALALLFRSKTSLGATAAFLCFWFGLNGVQINLFNYVQHKFGWSKVQGVKLQAMSGLILTLSNSILPALLARRFGHLNAMRLGMMGLVASLLTMGFAQSSSLFSLAVCGASTSTLCLPLLLSTLASCYHTEEAGSCLSALETANTLNRALAYFSLSRVFGWSLMKDKTFLGLFFIIGAVAVSLGMVIFETTVAVQAQNEINVILKSS